MEHRSERQARRYNQISKSRSEEATLRIERDDADDEPVHGRLSKPQSPRLFLGFVGLVANLAAIALLLKETPQFIVAIIGCVAVVLASGALLSNVFRGGRSPVQPRLEIVLVVELLVVIVSSGIVGSVITRSNDERVGGVTGSPFQGGSTPTTSTASPTSTWPTATRLPSSSAPTPTSIEESQYQDVYSGQELQVPPGSCPFQTEVDLDEPRVNPQDGSDLHYGRQCGSNDYRTIYVYNLAALVDESVSSAEQCDSAIKQRPTGKGANVEAREDKSLCLLTDKGRISLVKVGPLIGPEGRETVTITSTAWEPRS